jgi:hypothetical protein
LRSAFTLALAAFLVVLSPWRLASIAAEGPVNEKSADQRQDPTVSRDLMENSPPGRSLREKITDIGKSLDATHDSLERTILEQTIRIDDFLGKTRSTELRPTAYEIHWRNSVRLERGGTLKLGTSARASAVLSKISERLRLTISGDNEPDQISPSLPEDPGNPGLDRTSRTTRLVNTELRYDLFRRPSMDLFLGAGVRVVLPLEAFVRSRFQYTSDIGHGISIRVAETFFMKNRDWLGETTEISLERLLGAGTLLRWSASGTASQEIKGLEWGSELALMHALSTRSGITVAGGVYGNTNSSAVAGTYRVLGRYRRNFLRPWLFYELEPEVTWPRGAEGHYQPVFAFTFRIETAFQGAAGPNGKSFGAY